MGGDGLELVGGAGEWQSGQLRHMGGETFGEARGRVQSGAHGGRALSQRIEPRQTGLDTGHAGFDLRRVAGKLLPERDRSGILKVRAPELHNIVPGFALGVKRCVQMRECRHQLVRKLPRGGNMHGRGETVVGGLRAIDVVVGVHRRLRSSDAAEL